MRKMLREFSQAILWSYVLFREAIKDFFAKKPTHCATCFYGVVSENYNFPKGYCRYNQKLVQDVRMYDCQHWEDNRKWKQLSGK